MDGSTRGHDPKVWHRLLGVHWSWTGPKKFWAQRRFGWAVERVPFVVLYSMHRSTEEQGELATFLNGTHGRFGYLVLACSSIDAGESLDESVRIGGADRSRTCQPDGFLQGILQ